MRGRQTNKQTSTTKVSGALLASPQGPAVAIGHRIDTARRSSWSALVDVQRVCALGLSCMCLGDHAGSHPALYLIGMQNQPQTGLELLNPQLITGNQPRAHLSAWQLEAWKKPSWPTVTRLFVRLFT